MPALILMSLAVAAGAGATYAGCLGAAPRLYDAAPGHPSLESSGATVLSTVGYTPASAAAAEAEPPEPTVLEIQFPSLEAGQEINDTAARALLACGNLFSLPDLEPPDTELECSLDIGMACTYAPYRPRAHPTRADASHRASTCPTTARSTNASATRTCLGPSTRPKISDSP
mmetsp:Transcript_22861/g.68586  ORF Transcript_22861/g.68586 Transcript_22861/m.68586 type:complete len:172 (+) Transcript_22861:1123-1638(+)